jgi:hypothetical protein
MLPGADFAPFRFASRDEVLSLAGGDAPGRIQALKDFA